MQDVKLKLGLINNQGQQKEVDSLLITDLIDLARNQAICDATLVTGDTDVRIAVQIAQSFRVRVHLIGLEPSSASQSRALREEVDTICEIGRADVSRFLRSASQAAATPVPAIVNKTVLPPVDVKAGSTAGVGTAPPSEERLRRSESILEEAVDRFIASSIPVEDIPRLLADLNATRKIPPEYDRKLLGSCGSALNNKDLTLDERRQMRKYFEQRLRALAPPI